MLLLSQYTWILMARFVNFSKRIALETLWSFWVTVSLGCDAHIHSTCQSGQISVIWFHLISSSFLHKISNLFRISISTSNESVSTNGMYHNECYITYGLLKGPFLTVVWSLTWCLVVILFIWTHCQQIGPKNAPNNTSSPGSVCLCLYILISDAIVRLPPQILATGVSHVTFHTHLKKSIFDPPHK
jgi:hypothetical protein